MIEIIFEDGGVLRYYYNQEGEIMVEVWLRGVCRISILPIDNKTNLWGASRVWRTLPCVKSIKEY